MAQSGDPLANIPPNFKPLQHYIKTAAEHHTRDPAVAYYCRLYAMQKGMELDRKSPDCRSYLQVLMNSLEQGKKQYKDNEAIQNEIVGQAHLENYALKLFSHADTDDRAGNFGKNVVKLFYTAGMLMDVLATFGELSEEIEKSRKYAKWKAAYIHNCLKNGETPHAGPLEEEGGPGEGYGDFNSGPVGGGSSSGGNPSHSNSSSESGHTPAPIPRSSPQCPPQPSPYSQPAETVRYQAPQLPAVTGAVAGVKLRPEDYTKAMKFCKYATSALQYEDAKTAIDNLTKALNLLSSGHE